MRTKKDKKIEALELEVLVLTDETEDLKDLVHGHKLANAALDKSARHYREMYELSLATPEVKADVEAAFKRGTSHKAHQFAAWLRESANQIVENEDRTLRLVKDAEL